MALLNAEPGKAPVRSLLDGKDNIIHNKEYPSTATTQEGTQGRKQLRARKRTVVQSVVHIDAGRRCRCSKTDSGCDYVQEYDSVFCLYCRPGTSGSLPCACPCRACDSCSDSESADTDDDGDVEVSNKVPSCCFGFFRKKRALVGGRGESLARAGRVIFRPSI